MKLKRYAALACLAALTICGTLAGCSSAGGEKAFVNPGDNLGGGGAGTTPTEIESDTENTVNESTRDVSGLKSDTDSSSATETEAGATALEITENGDYLLSGEYLGGVTIAKGLTVHLFLNGANVSNSAGAAISTGKKCKVTITAVDGTQNTVTNSVAADSEDSANAIHVKGSLVINGSGALSVTSESKGAIKSSGALTVVDVALTLSSVGNAISAESVDMDGASVTVTSSGKDGIHAECDYDEPDDASECVFTTSKGYASLKDVAYTCSCEGDGIQADTFVAISGSTLNIKTTGTFVSYSEKDTYELEDDDYRYRKSGSAYTKIASDEANNLSSLYALKQGCKGIKVGEIEYDTDGDGVDDVTVTENTAYSIVISESTVTVDSTDDCIHSNSGDIIIKSGTYTLNTYDDGITCDNLLDVRGGDITVESCYEGLEGAYITISGGKINVTASDDGINAASDITSVSEYIVIHGGEVTVNAEGDGLDSNGSILIDGGTVTVYGPTNGGDAGLDSETGVIINGGTVFVSSSLGMVETPSTNSSQYTLSFATRQSIAADITLTIVDGDGNTVYSVVTQKTCQSLIISLPDFAQGSTYTIYGGNTSLGSFTVSGSKIISVGSSSTPSGGGFSGGHGGRR